MHDKKIVYLLIPAICALVLGIALIFPTFYGTYASLEDEHQAHLLDIAWSTDRNLAAALSQCREELRFTITYEQNEENPFTREGSTTMQTYLAQFPLTRADYVSAILLLHGDQPVFSSDPVNPNDYSFPLGISAEDPCLCVNSDGENYLAIIQQSPHYDVSYAALIDLTTFYRQIAGNELTDEYWLVLYNLENGLFLQNDRKQPELKLISAEEAIARQDGITILVESELNQTINTIGYVFNDTKYHDRYRNLMAVIPSELNSNGVFAIGVAVSSAGLEALVRHFFIGIGLCSVLVVAGISILLLLIMRNRRTNAELREKTELLREQNESMQTLLDKTQELAHHQRLEMIGTLTSGIAHEFSNLLTPIMGYSIMSMEKLPEGSDELMDNLAEIYSASKRAKTLISRISALSRKNIESAMQLLSPDQVMDKAEEMARQSKPIKVEVRKEYLCTESIIRASETQIIQMLLNMILNAFQAMEEGGGVLTLITEASTLEVFLRVRDTGSGIAPEVIEHIFDPFFTTKDPGNGTGLGLAVSKEIAERHGGQITVKSRPGSGTQFTISLPRYEQAH